MRALFIDTLKMRWIKCVPLASEDELLLSLDLVWVIAASGSSDSHELAVNIKDEIVLPHQSTTNNHFVSVLNIKSHTVTVGLLAVEVLTWVPLE